MTELICTNCDTRQAVQAECQKCNVRFGKVWVFIFMYQCSFSFISSLFSIRKFQFFVPFVFTSSLQFTCLICNLFDDEDKDQYHCDGCGICRIGGRNNFFHCEVCNMCLPLQLKTDGHRVSSIRFM